MLGIVFINGRHVLQYCLEKGVWQLKEQNETNLSALSKTRFWNLLTHIIVQFVENIYIYT